MMLTDKEKMQRLEQAVMSESIEETRRVYVELGEVSYTGLALGLACLYRGLDMVKMLAEHGAGFKYPDEKECSGSERRFSVFRYTQSGFAVDHSLMLIGRTKIGTWEFKPADRVEALPLAERLKIAGYLCDNAEKIGFEPQRLLYFSIRDINVEFYETLKRHGVKIPENARWVFANASNFSYAIDPPDFIKLFGMIARELDGEKINVNMTFCKSYIGNFLNPEIFEFILENFDRKGMHQMNIMKNMVDKQAVDCLEIAEREGWLKYPKKRDELIQYAADNGKAESAAWLLNFKNRTADLAAERAKAEKKAERELNAAPDSAAALKQLWSCKKREDGTLSISKYKGSQTVVNVPEKIGKSVVTNLGSGVLASGGVPGVSAEQTAIRKKITKITLPAGLRSIGYYAFLGLESLEEINLPDGLNGITTGAFKDCVSLKSITIPGSAKKIGNSAFMGCCSLKSVIIEEGVAEIGEHAFKDCGGLEIIDFPKSVGLIDNIAGNGIVNGAFPKLTAKVFKGSFAERYCLKNKIKILYKQSADDSGADN